MTLPSPTEPSPQSVAMAAPPHDRATLVREALAAPRPRDGAVLLLVSLVVFVIALGETKPMELAILVAVLLWHESGHLVAMRASGVADVRMFFLPFFGAAVSGRKPGASACEHAIVSLAGPLPGILLALPLLALVPSGWWSDPKASFVDQAPWTVQLVMMLALLNAINLVPILPLDGGRLFETLVFARWPLLDVGFRVLTIAALGSLGLNGDVLFGVLAVLFLLSLRYHMRIAFDAARLRRERPWPTDPGALTDADLLALHAAAQAVMPTTGAPQNRTVLQAAVQIFDRVARRPATLLQTLLLLVVWFFGLVLAAGELIWVMAHAK